ncbi:hypothetical protein RR46_10970 [Papilio xuthus]|uniref:Uncharacterized protein n=1 Tax=Papilio xuthus TaxID=66420 RepID=A0A194PYM3_PAPXU|nr:hypothetical protein RR46_10970 [Papilio xuthus]
MKNISVNRVLPHKAEPAHYNYITSPITNNLAKLNHFPSALCGSGTDNKQNKFQDLRPLSIKPKHTSRIPKNKSEQDWFNQSNRDQHNILEGKTNHSPISAPPTLCQHRDTKGFH